MCAGWSCVVLPVVHTAVDSSTAFVAYATHSIHVLVLVAILFKRCSVCEKICCIKGTSSPPSPNRHTSLNADVSPGKLFFVFFPFIRSVRHPFYACSCSCCSMETVVVPTVLVSSYGLYQLVLLQQLLLQLMIMIGPESRQATLVLHGAASVAKVRHAHLLDKTD
jgi:hypothetical protein